jgi:ABC-type glycerol-3-phosphate transport system substrate-binding protein
MAIGQAPHAPALCLTLMLLVTGAAGCLGGKDADEDVDPATQRITVWSLEYQPDRLRATKANLAAFTRATQIGVDLVPIGDDELPARMARARSTGNLPDVAQLPLDSLHTYAEEDLLDTTIPQDVLENLGDETFSQTALSLASQEARVVGVPSDGWGQLLIYRRDLFESAGLQRPSTLQDVQRAARRLNRGRLAGITLPNAPDENFTAEVFEHIALATGCELVDDRGDVSLDTPSCRRAFEFYVALARDGARRSAGPTTRDTARDLYFAGRTAMIFWSPFVLDAMAGLRDDAKPSCPECRRDAAFLARNSGLVGPLSDGHGAPAQYGSISSWGVFRDADVDAARRFVEYMLSDGYVRWLALSPQGKFPVRNGDATDPERYYNAWKDLQSGVERKAPLGDFYSEEAIASIGEGVRAFRRWGFPHGQAALAGALRDEQPLSRAIADAVDGRTTAAEAAARVQAAVEGLDAPGR